MKWLGLVTMLPIALGASPHQDNDYAWFEKTEKDRKHCRAAMMTFANAAMAHRVKSGQEGFTSDLRDLDQYIGQPLECPNGGIYSIVPGLPEKSFTIHCTLLRHDAGRVQPAGFSPRVNTDSDIFARTEALSPAQPARTRCRARMAMISDEQINYLLDNGRFTSDVEQLFGVEVNCPGGGTYSIALGKPKHSFTIHCNIAEHDAGMVEPRGYSPGRNWE